MLPLFIEWDEQTSLPGQAAIRHPAGTAEDPGLSLTGIRAVLADWLGSHQLPIVVREGPPGVTAVYVSSDASEIILGV